MHVEFLFNLEKKYTPKIQLIDQFISILQDLDLCNLTNYGVLIANYDHLEDSIIILNSLKQEGKLTKINVVRLLEVLGASPEILLACNKLAHLKWFQPLEILIENGLDAINLANGIALLRQKSLIETHLPTLLEHPSQAHKLARSIMILYSDDFLTVPRINLLLKSPANSIGIARIICIFTKSGMFSVEIIEEILATLPSISFIKNLKDILKSMFACGLVNQDNYRTLIRYSAYVYDMAKYMDENPLKTQKDFDSMTQKAYDLKTKRNREEKEDFFNDPSRNKRERKYPNTMFPTESYVISYEVNTSSSHPELR